MPRALNTDVVLTRFTNVAAQWADRSFWLVNYP